ncbi:hypothetical protein [Streptomyces sp. NPDC012888]|uniref:hypothetical protein n=1 Tax=Streptomyces sp. NPDC012888 TaxID=3364855 RepID=UPI0036876C3E
MLIPWDDPGTAARTTRVTRWWPAPSGIRDDSLETHGRRVRPYEHGSLVVVRAVTHGS